MHGQFKLIHKKGKLIYTSEKHSHSIASCRFTLASSHYINVTSIFTAPPHGNHRFDLSDHKHTINLAEDCKYLIFLTLTGTAWQKKAITGYSNTSFSSDRYYIGVILALCRSESPATRLIFHICIQASHKLKRFANPENSPHKRSLQFNKTENEFKPSIPYQICCYNPSYMSICLETQHHQCLNHRKRVSYVCTMVICHLRLINRFVI